MTWADFAQGNPELAAFGLERLTADVAYLATVRKDGAPRVHPVTPIIGEGRMFVFMEPSSRKGHDLRRDGRYALHCGVEDATGGEGEFYIFGRGLVVADADSRAMATRLSTYAPKDRYVLFELLVDNALSNVYTAAGNTMTLWQRPYDDLEAINQAEE